MSTQPTLSTAAPSSVVAMLNSITPLTDTNYHSWIKGMRMFFLAADVDWINNSATSVPSGSELMDKKMLSFIWSRISPEYQFLVEELDSGLAAWKALKDRFQKSTMARRIKARSDFHHVCHDPEKPIDIYLNSVETACNILKGLGCNIDDTEVIDVLLMNLDESFEGIRTSILSSKSEPSLTDIKAMLIASSSAISIKHETKLEAVFATRSSQFKKTAPPSGLSPPDDRGYRWCSAANGDNCHRCGRPYHIAVRCILDMPPHIKDWVLGKSTSDQSNIASTESQETEQVHSTFVDQPPRLI
jgi:gag-polypeptide of LTR copia-type